MVLKFSLDLLVFVNVAQCPQGCSFVPSRGHVVILRIDCSIGSVAGERFVAHRVRLRMLRNSRLAQQVRNRGIVGTFVPITIRTVAVELGELGSGFGPWRHVEGSRCSGWKGLDK